MERGVLLTLVVCLALAGGVAADSGSGHIEPKKVTASCGSDSATVRWSAVRDSHLAGYDVYEKAAGESAYERANTQLVRTTTYLVTGLLPATSYNFGVVSVYDDGHTSAMSAPATCTTA